MTTATGSIKPGMLISPVIKPVTSEWPKTYVVKEGDSLEAIAKKMYGAAEGAKPASIKRIFEANKSLLKSPELLSIGQKLAVPVPAGGSSTTIVAVPVGREPSASPKPAVAAASTSQGQHLYVVRDGDSLWKIATSQLGKGTRYREILKLNAETLKNDEDNLEVGMKLHLPAK